MATKSQEILLKGNTTNASAVPSSLKVREIAINALDRSLFTNDGNSIVKLYTGTNKWFDVNGNANNALKLGGILASEYINKEAFNSHINNSTIHITANERTAWNNKWDYNEETIKAVKVNAAVLSDKATKLATTRKIWGKPFDGSGDVSGDLTEVGNITASGKATIQGDIISGGEVVAVAGEGTPAGVTDYSALTGKPAINGVTLVSGNNTLATLGIQAAGDYATNSGVTTLLANYADKTFVSNNYAGKAAFNSHTADTDIHITAAERVDWNAKWDYNEATIKAVKVTSASSADSVAWSGITGKPTTFTPSAHTHTASEVSGLPTKLSAFTNDVGFITGITKSMVEGVLTGNITSHTHSQYLTSALRPATLTTDGSHSNGYYKIRITNQVSSWMLSFDVKMVHYSSYTIRFNGSNYNMSESWFNPSASMIDGEDSIEVKFGYDTTPYLWVAIPASSRMGISITNVANGFIPIDTYALDKLFTITYESELSGTTQQTITLYPPSKEGHTHTASEVSGLPTSLKNPYALTFGSKTYDGSAAKTITASDLGALTAHQSIYALTLQVNGTSKGTYNPASAAKTINIAVPTKTSQITNDSGFITSASIPTALKNPYAVEIKANGVSLGTYDGSKAATFNLSAANVGAANKVHTHTASEISGLPTNLSSFTNDVGYITGITKSMVEGVLTGNITSHTHSYLPLSGGTISGILTIKTNGYPLIEFKAGDTTYGYYGFSKTGVAAIWDTKNWHTLIHAGNYNSYSPTLTGTGASGTWGINISGNAASADVIATTYKNQSINFAKNDSKIRLITGTSSDAIANGFPIEYVGGISAISSYVGWQMITYGGSTISNPYFRQVFDNNVWSDWKQLAFLTDNVASATKLQDNTAFTAWGQTFFQSGKPKNVNGDLSMEWSKIYWNGDIAGSYISTNGMNSMTYSARDGHIFQVAGDEILRIKKYETYKLQVSGKTHITGDLIVDGEVSALVA